MKAAIAFCSMILWMTAASSAWAIVPSDCAAGDLDCPVPQGLKWECGFIHRLSLQADASTGAVKGWLGLSPKYGGNTVQSAMTCHAEGSADVCAVDTSVAQICDSQDCHYAPWAQKGAKIASIDRLTGKATIVGVDRFRSDLNPAADEWPLRLDCQNRDQVIKSKIRPHECANAELKITTYYSFGFANFYIRGERDGSPVKCQGQMFSAGAGGSDFMLGRTETCPFDFAIVSKGENKIDLSCDRDSCKAASLACKER